MATERPDLSVNLTLPIMPFEAQVGGLLAILQEFANATRPLSRPGFLGEGHIGDVAQCLFAAFAVFCPFTILFGLVLGILGGDSLLLLGQAGGVGEFAGAIGLEGLPKTEG